MSEHSENNFGSPEKLSREVELQLFTQLQDLKELPETEEMIEEIQTIKNEIVMSTVPYVQGVIDSYYTKYTGELTKEDLEIIEILTVYKSIDQYDPSYGHPFKTFLARNIYSHLQYLSEQKHYANLLPLEEYTEELVDQDSTYTNTISDQLDFVERNLSKEEKDILYKNIVLEIPLEQIEKLVGKGRETVRGIKEKAILKLRVGWLMEVNRDTEILHTLMTKAYLSPEEILILSMYIGIFGFSKHSLEDIPKENGLPSLSNLRKRLSVISEKMDRAVHKSIVDDLTEKELKQLYYHFQYILGAPLNPFSFRDRLRHIDYRLLRRVLTNMEVA